MTARERRIFEYGLAYGRDSQHPKSIFWRTDDDEMTAYFEKNDIWNIPE